MVSKTATTMRWRTISSSLKARPSQPLSDPSRARRVVCAILNLALEGDGVSGPAECISLSAGSSLRNLSVCGIPRFRLGSTAGFTAMTTRAVSVGAGGVQVPEGRTKIAQRFQRWDAKSKANRVPKGRKSRHANISFCRPYRDVCVERWSSRLPLPKRQRADAVQDAPRIVGRLERAPAFGLRQSPGAFR